MSLLLFVLLVVHSSPGGQLVHAGSEHRTKAALEKVSDLYCYKCDTIDNEERCLHIKDNSTIEKCDKEQRICQVQTITMSTPTDEKGHPPKLWLLKRACSKICDPVCVTIGERTKLRACNTCCETSYCNTGNAATRCHFHATSIGVLLVAALLLVAVVATSGFVDDDRSMYAKRY